MDDRRRANVVDGHVWILREVCALADGGDLPDRDSLFRRFGESMNDMDRFATDLVDQDVHKDVTDFLADSVLSLSPTEVRDKCGGYLARLEAVLREPDVAR